MAVDTPAKIAILGAGPIGLEAALYARFLGYQVMVFERGEVADNVLRWGHVKMFSPFRLNRSALALAALAAQDEDYQPPGDDELLTGQAWVERYLSPLSRTDLVADGIQTHTEVVSVSRLGWRKNQGVGDRQRADAPFLLLTRCGDTEQHVECDVVIDATGVYGGPNFVGPGGLPAIGESQLRDRIEYGIPDVLGSQRERYADRRTLLVGSGYSAATTALALSQLAESAPGTQVTWVTNPVTEAGDVITPIPDDSLEERARLIQRANQCVTECAALEHRPGAAVERITHSDSGFQVSFFGEEPAAESTFDNLVANVGYHGDNGLFEELQVHQCYATGGPMKLAATLLANPSEDCLDQTPCGADALRTTEAHFYLLGAKSFGRNSRFLFANGLEQIRELFTIIGDRQDLNLYATVTLPS